MSVLVRGVRRELVEAVRVGKKRAQTRLHSEARVDDFARQTSYYAQIKLSATRRKHSFEPSKDTQ